MTLEIITTAANARRNAIYDGTNGAEIVAQFGDLVSDDGETLVFTDTGFPLLEFTATVGQVISWGVEFAEGAGTNGFGAEFLGKLPNVVIPDRPVKVTRSGKGSLVEKALGGTQDVTVTLDSPMPSSSWVPDFVTILGAPGLAGLGGHGITGWTVVDEETITVHVSSAVGALASTDAVYVSVIDLV